MAYDDPTEVLDDDVNAAGVRAATTGVGAPGSSAVTDQTNLNLAAAMSRGDRFNGGGGFQPQAPTADVLRASRSVPDMVTNALEGRRALLASSLANNTDPDAPARYVSPRRHLELVHELGSVGSEIHRTALTRAAEAHDTFRQERDIQTANDFTGLVHDLSNTQFPITDPRHATEVMGIMSNHPFASQSAAGRELLKTHVGTVTNALSLTPPAGMEVDHVVQSNDGKSHTVYKPISNAAANEGADHWVSRDAALKDNPGATVEQTKDGWKVTSYKDGTTPPVKPAEVKQYGLTQGQFDSRTSTAVVDDKGEGNLTGNFVKVGYMDKAGKPATALLPKSEYTRFGGKLAPESQSVSTPAGPEIGTVKNGYRFKGGDPADKNNWEKQ